MEDALALVVVNFINKEYGKVLILVLMEDALALIPSGKYAALFTKGLNPCFNGRCTRTHQLRIIRNMLYVLILVLMEDALAHTIPIWILAPKRYVLILVLMEDALAQQN